VKFQFSGTLFTPAPGETARVEKEETEAKAARTRVKLNFKDFVRTA